MDSIFAVVDKFLKMAHLIILLQKEYTIAPHYFGQLAEMFISWKNSKQCEAVTTLEEFSRRHLKHLLKLSIYF